MARLEHNVQRIAIEQLRAAIHLHMEAREPKDYYAVVTLAGAAEEILGQLLKKRGGVNSLERHKILVQSVTEGLQDQDIASSANSVRNSLKHWPPKRTVFDAEDEAWDMLSRAIGNYRNLSGALPDDMNLDAELASLAKLDSVWGD